MSDTSIIWICITVIVILLILFAVLLYVNSIYRRRRRRVLYRLAMGKTAFEDTKDNPITEPQSSDPDEDVSSDSIENVTIDANTAEKEDSTSTKRIDIEIAREKLWERMEKYMKEKEPFTDPDFDRNQLAKVLYSNISYVSGAINAHGKSFTTWLAEYRVKAAIDILHQNTKIPVRELCVKVGVLNPVVFNRQFRGVTGMSVSEFRSQIGVQD